jgi:hypothetical protein
MRSEIVKFKHTLWLTHKVDIIVSGACWVVGFKIFDIYLTAKNYGDFPLCFLGFLSCFISGIFFNNALNTFRQYKDVKKLLERFDEKKN